MLYLSLSLPPTSNHRLMPTMRGRGLGLTKGPKYRAWMDREAARLDGQGSGSYRLWAT